MTERLQTRSRNVEQALAAPAHEIGGDRNEEGLSFEELYRSSRDDVFSYVAGLLRDGSSAEEVTATDFERAYRRRRRFDPQRGTPRAWLFGIARNAALDELRRCGRQAEILGDPAAGARAGRPEVLRRAVEHGDRRRARRQRVEHPDAASPRRDQAEGGMR